jgi:hypothetical protein
MGGVRGLKFDRVTDAIGFFAYRQDQHGAGAPSALTFVSNERGYAVLAAIRTCVKDIRSGAPNCQIAAEIDAIGDRIEAVLKANEAEPA